MNSLEEIITTRHRIKNIPSFRFLKSTYDCIQYAGHNSRIKIHSKSTFVKRMNAIEETTKYRKKINDLIVTKSIHGTYVIADKFNKDTLDYYFDLYSRMTTMLKNPKIPFINYNVKKMHDNLVRLFNTLYKDIDLTTDHLLKHDHKITRMTLVENMPRAKLDEIIEAAIVSHPYYVRTFMIANKLDITIKLEDHIRAYISIEDKIEINKYTCYETNKAKIQKTRLELITKTPNSFDGTIKHLIQICKLSKPCERKLLDNYTLVCFAKRCGELYQDYYIDISKKNKAAVRDYCSNRIIKQHFLPIKPIDMVNAIRSYHNKITPGLPFQYLMTKYITKNIPDTTDECHICMEQYDITTQMNYPIDFCSTCKKNICTKCFINCKSTTCPFCRTPYERLCL